MNEAVSPLAAGALADDADIGEAILAANRVFVAIASRALTGLRPEVTLPQLRTLVLLDLQHSMTMGELANALGVVPSTATRMCDRLVAKKLILRNTDPDNRRRVSITLLPRGAQLIESSTQRRRAEIERVLAVIGPAERVQLSAALKVFVRAANTLTDLPTG